MKYKITYNTPLVKHLTVTDLNDDVLLFDSYEDAQRFIMGALRQTRMRCFEFFIHEVVEDDDYEDEDMTPEEFYERYGW